MDFSSLMGSGGDGGMDFSSLMGGGGGGGKGSKLATSQAHSTINSGGGQFDFSALMPLALIGAGFVALIVIVKLVFK